MSKNGKSRSYTRPMGPTSGFGMNSGGTRHSGATHGTAPSKAKPASASHGEAVGGRPAAAAHGSAPSGSRPSGASGGSAPTKTRPAHASGSGAYNQLKSSGGAKRMYDGSGTGGE